MAADAHGTPKYDVKQACGAIARIHTQGKEPSDDQQAWLADFMRRYIERTRMSKTFTEANRSHMADPRVVNGFRPATKEITYQVVVERSKASKLWDVDGNECVDALNGFGMNLFGWQPDFITDAVRAQLDAGYEIGPQHPLAADVTRLVCELTGFDRAGLCNTGSEAVMAALRIARTVTGRGTVALFTGSYHGTFDEVPVRAGRDTRGLSAVPGVLQGKFGDVRVLDYGTPKHWSSSATTRLSWLPFWWSPAESPPRSAAPRVPTGSAGNHRGIRDLPDLRRGHHRIPLRPRRGASAVRHSRRPGLLRQGDRRWLPVGVIAGKRPYMDALDGGTWQYGDDSMPTVGVTYFAGTFVRHPLALTAAKASLAYLKQDNNTLQPLLNQRTAAMAEDLTAFCRGVGAPLEIQHFSSLWRVRWLEDHPLQDLLFPMMRMRGVHILETFPCFLTTAHSEQDIATIAAAFKESVTELRAVGLLGQ